MPNIYIFPTDIGNFIIYIYNLQSNLGETKNNNNLHTFFAKSFSTKISFRLLNVVWSNDNDVVFDFWLG